MVAVLGSVSCITRNIDYFVKRPSRAGIYSSLKVTVLSLVETTAAERYSYTGQNTLLSGYCFRPSKFLHSEHRSKLRWSEYRNFTIGNRSATTGHQNSE